MSSRYKRANTRYMVRLETQIIHGDQSTTGWIVDLSLGGALVEVSSEASIRVGSRLDVSFGLPELDQPLTAKAEVRWVEEHAIGIQFVTGFRAKQTWALGKFLERQTPAAP
ncbi:MAG: PilZ domain-containing protein [Myxococcales bacterium]|nr:PilZ domain-containing protein [Myxococcales bacterium]